MSEFDPVSFIMGAKSGSGGGGGGSGGGYDIVLRVNTSEGDIQSITQISMDLNAVIAKAEALQPITALVYYVEQMNDTALVGTYLAETFFDLYQGSLSGLYITITRIGVSRYVTLGYNPAEDYWFED